MTQPKNYYRTKDFAENNPDQVDLNAINQELDAISFSLNRTNNNLSEIQMDDGKLVPGIIEYDNLSLDAQERLTPIPGKDGSDGKDGKDGEKGDVGASFVADRVGTESERPLFSSMQKGFSFLAMDTAKLYWKLSDDTGDWSDGVTFGKGDKGDKGDTGEKGDPGVQGVQGIPGERGLPGTKGDDGLVTSVDTSTKSVSVVGKRYVTARLVITEGRLSIILGAEA